MTLYFFSQAAEALKRILEEAPRETDPIDHPAIAAMSLAELADLPLRSDCHVPRVLPLCVGVDLPKTAATPPTPFAPRRRESRTG
jgi:hypothetical protein